MIGFTIRVQRKPLQIVIMMDLKGLAYGEVDVVENGRHLCMASVVRKSNWRRFT